MRAITLIEALIVAAIVIVLVIVLIPVVANDHGSRMSTRCLSNVKQCVTALAIYVGDFNDRLPLRDEWMDSILPYTRNERSLHCPAVQEANELNQHLYGYSFDSRLSGADVSKVGNPVQTVLVFESVNLARNASDPFISQPDPPRKHGNKSGNMIGYLDGHAERTSISP